MSEFAFTLPSFAKINWNLNVIGRREDGFHELFTIFQTVSLHDQITFSESDRLVLTSSDPNMPTDQSNLVLRAANELRKRFGILKGAKIDLEKRIPFPGGLGGGSSNAAVALIGLARIWKIAVSPFELCKIGESIGSDVPFFFHGGTALGSGRGIEIESITDIVENFMLVVTPGVKVSTANAFALLGMPRLTKSESKSILQICRLEAKELNFRQSGLKNDFENAVFEIEPEIGRVKKKLFDLGAKQALMSGSGASVFAVFETEEKLKSAIDVLRVEKAWRVFSVKTVSREDYLESLSLVQNFLY